MNKRRDDLVDRGPTLTGDMLQLPEEHLRPARPGKKATSQTPVIITTAVAIALLASGAFLIFSKDSTHAAPAPEAPPVTAAPPVTEAPKPIEAVVPPAEPPKPVEAKKTAEASKPPAPTERSQPKVEQANAQVKLERTEVAKTAHPLRKRVVKRRRAPDRRTEKALDSAMDRLLSQPDAE